LYTVLIDGVETICTDQLPTFRVFSKSIFYAGIRIFNSLPLVSQVLRMEMHNRKYHSEGT